MKKINYKTLCKICKTKQNENLKDYCSIKIGGTAKFVCFPNTVKKLKKLIKYLQKTHYRYYILGNGTNVFFEDAFFNMVFICLKDLKKIYHRRKNLIAYAGCNLFAANYYAREHKLSGLEFSYGIPGTIGGAVVMNAGCFEHEFKDITKKVFAYQSGRIVIFNNSEINFRYRDSIFKNSDMIVVKVVLKLKKDSKSQIMANQNEYLQKRLDAQPYGTLNCGSVFKKSGNKSAGKIIDKVGLKGVKIGDIEISTKHANFFINNGNATSLDMLSAINFVKNQVCKYDKTILQEEVIYIRS